jgi:hypothetical protein
MPEPTRLAAFELMRIGIKPEDEDDKAEEEDE